MDQFLVRTAFSATITTTATATELWTWEFELLTLDFFKLLLLRISQYAEGFLFGLFANFAHFCHILWIKSS